MIHTRLLKQTGCQSVHQNTYMHIYTFADKFTLLFVMLINRHYLAHCVCVCV